ITCVSLLIFKIDTCDSVNEHTACEYHHVDMRRINHTVFCGHGSRANGPKPETSRVYCVRTSEPIEMGVRLGLAWIGLVGINAIGISLPYFDHRIGHRFAITIQHASFDDDALAL